ncbi:unnamed protein product [Brachionus calyciflorus]|uniref:FLYWCH-type domain-containing protein n=1 Tax=Brachionus calyciflorus TaxID=104777 RepID=A0A813YYM3_9BILA|nr:unnamed protein product [Brachionus calyciflorus]
MEEESSSDESESDSDGDSVTQIEKENCTPEEISLNDKNYQTIWPRPFSFPVDRLSEKLTKRLRKPNKILKKKNVKEIINVLINKIISLEYLTKQDAIYTMDELINNLEQFSISQSQRGGKLLIYKNFEFKIDFIAKSTNKHTWRCNQNPACKARCYTIGLDPPFTENEHSHSHPAKPAKIEIRQAINNMKEMAKSNQKSMRFIIQQSQTNLSTETQAYLPSYEALRQRIYNAKENPYAHLPKPTSLVDICIPEEFKYTCKNELFLHHDTGSNDIERIIIFATEKNIQLLNTHPNDGTFKVAPGLFYILLDNRIKEFINSYSRNNAMEYLENLSLIIDY